MTRAAPILAVTGRRWRERRRQFAHVLAEHDHALVALHLESECLVDSLDDGELRPSLPVETPELIGQARRRLSVDCAK